MSNAKSPQSKTIKPFSSPQGKSASITFQVRFDNHPAEWLPSPKFFYLRGRFYSEKPIRSFWSSPVKRKKTLKQWLQHSKTPMTNYIREMYKATQQTKHTIILISDNTWRMPLSSQHNHVKAISFTTSFAINFSKDSIMFKPNCKLQTDEILVWLLKTSTSKMVKRGKERKT